jgi:histidinol-phosphate/aromatic aminotransferase/cobyric acid decarboxylase-like protein
MTVGELIERLMSMPENAKVVACDDAFGFYEVAANLEALRWVKVRNPQFNGGKPMSYAWPDAGDADGEIHDVCFIH